MRFQKWPSQCACGFTGGILGWDYNFPLPCPVCSALTELRADSREKSPGITTDSIPGGYEVRHGLVKEDGSPMKFYSRTDMKREANRRGLTMKGDTPKSYKVRWEGTRDEDS